MTGIIQPDVPPEYTLEKNGDGTYTIYFGRNVPGLHGFNLGKLSDLSWNGADLPEKIRQGLNLLSWPPGQQQKHNSLVLVDLDKYNALARFFDEQAGTPCEQIRHQQELEAAVGALKEAREALMRFADHVNGTAFGPIFAKSLGRLTAVMNRLTR